MIFQTTSEPGAKYWRAIFDALPQPSFIVDEDMRILDYNVAAEGLLGQAPRSALHRRGGEVLHCVYAEKLGCGKSKPCQDCIIRTSVQNAINGLGTRRKFYEAELRGSRGVVPVNLLVTAALLPDTSPPKALLVLENVAETVRLYKRHAGP